MRRTLALALSAAALFAAGSASAQRFEFVAFGDMPYSIPGDYVKEERLIDRINTLAPAFSFHIGDTKSGSSPCSNEVLLRAKEMFQRIAGAVFYSVGDNEWTDCHRPAAGRFDPLERLDFVRKEHFSKAESLGQKPMALVRQPDAMPNFAKYVENSRWVHNGVLFVSVHIPGSNNNFEPRAGAPEEFMARNESNIAWIKAAFEEAKKPEIRGVVFGFQANMWLEQTPRDDLSSGYTGSINALTEGSIALEKPVLMIHGDTHLLTVDQPLKDAKKNTVQNATRLMVMGSSEIHAVRVIVDPSEPGLFGFMPVRIPENVPPKS